MSEIVGNPFSAPILQVVAYHNLTLVQFSLNKDSFKDTLKSWAASGKNIKSDISRKLSYAAISDITGIYNEIVGRSVKILAEQN